MQVRELAVPGAWEITPTQHGDDRGTFLEWYADPVVVEAIGHPLRLAQANLSVSAAGVVRGVHYADVPPGQAKHVTCVRGAVLDVVVDLRVGSPTFGTWDSVLLDDVDRRVVHIPEGLGHAFCALEDDSTVAYLCSTGYSPGREHGIDPLDPELGIAWPDRGRDGAPLVLRLSDKDAAAPRLAEALAAGALPDAGEVEAFRASLRAARPDAQGPTA
ncbi:DTDP-4-dehydrorhamnose 3,5-epimerase RmlC [Sediminihabitans luteus]|uniref:dTDP-4-dehydrorhamnose 3,5-epimerase family protein n=1 Tax=Sediminihabitans luteus TaxID=1138585 RepID=UPI000C23FA23|nr:dTDP-4-dehydrorhamnose 3,5-epimerase [Sediminihabitans luteus]GII99300.1 DTDP-4-dehydrorhamnose 3,5-epimerase RmlC [Sediminihabitans luteus]